MHDGTPYSFEIADGRTQAGFTAPANATPVDVSLMLREKGWRAYRVRADHIASAWVARSSIGSAQPE
jgi:hypothetical protein